MLLIGHESEVDRTKSAALIKTTSIALGVRTSILVSEEAYSGYQHRLGGLNLNTGLERAYSDYQHRLGGLNLNTGLEQAYSDYQHRLGCLILNTGLRTGFFRLPASPWVSDPQYWS